ncbi:MULTISPECIES: porin [Paraburkholderia]|uniref:Outer membrane porin protein n=2 Tax=Paraburkholderia TaxID=1822464 RepID=A0A6J5FJQ4_9BURK|nr:MULTISPECIES: porin [Paraburkholderia]GGC65702.1 porin [Paraburkholderia caffeinilytica]CAB3781723.1 Outer membrane porin protein [Paraburkholderia caffeinitolerans]CAB3802090.1 Outer membrane porin protein [Paraburkholderia caffeinilytica]
MINIRLSVIPFALVCAINTAYGQSSVALYGVIDDSLQFVHNTTDNKGSDANFIGMAGGNLQGPRWGLKGAEDLGGGLRAIFQLESGFNPNTGRLNQGGRQFGRQAFVGLASDHWGTVTVGRQYDPVVDQVQQFTADNYWGSTFSTPSDVDNNDNSSRTNNAVKYTSQTYAGFQVEAMYAFGGVAGSTGSGQTWSGAASYSNGPFSLAAGYLRMDNAGSAASRNGSWSAGATSDGTFNSINLPYQSAMSIRIVSIAGQYVSGPFTAGLRYSNAQYKPDAFSTFSFTEHYDVGAGFVSYQLTAATLLGLGYTFTHASGNGPSASYNQVSLGADYSVSKRTDVYVVGAYQRASGTGATATVADYDYPSGSRSQEIASLGIRHRF